MASLLKNQVLKHLSKFTKNLSPDKLQLSALKGSFEVNNIELNEKVLTDLLELPVWMSLTKAHCNFASIKIQWMKIKTVPIYIMLDEVVIEAETCETFRNENDCGGAMANKSNPNQETQGSYGFTNKVIDGIMLTINSVSIQFSSKIFSASIELTRITVESRNCYWKKSDDITKTRINDKARGQVLLFKHIEWQTLRFVAKSETLNTAGQAPLRLIANQASCRITLKKRLSDCAILGARIMVIFDDLLWVLTDSQLLSALHFADYLGTLIKRAPRTKQNFDCTTDHKRNSPSTNSGMLFNAAAAAAAAAAANAAGSPSKKMQSTSSTSLANSISILFGQFDFLETSFHLLVRRIEVHLMDDLGPQSERSQCAALGDGGALQITLLKLTIDLYPYQSVSGGRRHWLRYSEPSPNRASFINHKLRAFYATQQANLRNEGSNFNLQSLQHHLLSRVVVLRLADYTIGCVSTNNTRSNSKNDDTGSGGETNSEPIKLLTVDNSVQIPNNRNPIYLELNSYFYLEPFDRLNLPLPDTNIFAAVAPFRFHFEPLTILWINAFFANLRNALIKLQEAFPNPNASANDKVNLRAEIVMPTVVLDFNNLNNASNVINCANLSSSASSTSSTSSTVQRSEPSKYSAIELKISRILIYNCDPCIQPEYFRPLDGMLKYFSKNLQFYFEKNQFPWLGCDMRSISNEFVHQIRLASKASPSADDAEDNVVDFWTVQIEPLWIEFKSAQRYESFLEPINITMWAFAAPPPSSGDSTATNIDMNIFAKFNDPIKVQINHEQLLCLLRLLERIGEFTAMLNYDTYMIQRSHYRRDFADKYRINDSADDDGNRAQSIYAFDIDEKVLQAIFKNAAFVTTIPEVNVFLNLREYEEMETISIPNNAQAAPAESSEESTKNLIIGEQHRANNDEMVNMANESSNHDSNHTMLCIDQSADCTSISSSSSSSLFGENLNNNSPKPDSVNSLQTNTNHNPIQPQPQQQQQQQRPQLPQQQFAPSLLPANNTGTRRSVSTTFPQTPPPPPPSLSFNSNSHSFDSMNIRVHYSNNNTIDVEDTISTYSDLSADDSDQQSFIALMNGMTTSSDGSGGAGGGACQGTDSDSFEDLFLHEPNDLGVCEIAEMAEEISENFVVDSHASGKFVDNNIGDSIASDSTIATNDRRQSLSSHTTTTTTAAAAGVAPIVVAKTITYTDTLQIRLTDINLIQQSSKGFLSQICIDTSAPIEIEEHHRLSRANYLNRYKAAGRRQPESASSSPSSVDDHHRDDDDDHKDDRQQFRLTIRIDAFNKGSLRDEMISVRVLHLSQSLKKETIDLIVDFFNDPIADKPAPTAILLEDIQFKIVDDSIRMPPMVFAVPTLTLKRDKQNRWTVGELERRTSSFGKDFPLQNMLLLSHLKIFQRNLLHDIRALIAEEDRLTSARSIDSDNSQGPEREVTEQILKQVLDQKELLLQEIELLRKENAELRKNGKF